MKRLPQTLHSNGFSPVWPRKCLFRFPFSLKLSPHTVQSNGFSPEWQRKCLFKVDFRLKLSPHTVHRNGFTPVCTLWCWEKFPFVLKRLPHSVHSNILSPFWMERWLVSMSFFALSMIIPVLFCCAHTSPHSYDIPLLHVISGFVVIAAWKCFASARDNACSSPCTHPTLWESGPRLNMKTVLSTYGDFHVKDKTAVRTSYL